MNEWADFWTHRHYPGILADFIEPCDLVFDIGANIGKMTWAYRRMSANVLAVEPQSKCADELRKRYIDDGSVNILQAACGSEPSTAQMSCYGGTTISTLVPEHYWCDGGPWSGTPTDWTETVAVVTLDKLIEMFGVPSFIKIDVEGYEYQVLCGLSQFIPLQFEFHPCFADHALRTMARILELEPRARFCDTLAENLVPRGDWCGYDEMMGRIDSLFDKHGSRYFGNIYARKAIV